MASTTQPLSVLKTEPLRKTVMNAIREAIFSGRVAAGEPLREITLAREMGVSQATVREALVQLEHLGLVVRVPNLGTTVTKLSPKDLAERLQLRILLESQACVLASANLTEDDFKELEAKLMELAQKVAMNQYFESAQADLEFHRLIWRASGNELLCRLLDQVTTPMFAFVSMLRSTGLEKLRDVVLSHEPIMRALRSKDEAMIRTAIRDAVGNSYNKFL